MKKPDFWKEVINGFEGPYSPKKMALKRSFWDFEKKSDLFVSTFLPEYENSNGLLNFCKIQIWEKFSSWVMVPKPLDQSECRIL